MENFFYNNLGLIACLVLLIVISIMSLPLIYGAAKGELLFANYFSKRALIFSLANAVAITIILVIGSVVFGSAIPDESAGAGMMLMIKASLGFGLIYGFLFPYIALFLIDRANVT